MLKSAFVSSQAGDGEYTICFATFSNKSEVYEGVNRLKFLLTFFDFFFIRS